MRSSFGPDGRKGRFRSLPIVHIPTPPEVFSYGTISIYHTPCSIYDPKSIFQHGNVSRGARLANPAWQGPIYLRHSSVSANFIEKMKDDRFSRLSTQLMSESMYMSATWTMPFLLVKPVLGPRTRTASEKLLPSICGKCSYDIIIALVVLLSSFLCLDPWYTSRGTTRGLA